MQSQLLIINPKTSVYEYVNNFLLNLIKQKDPNNFENYYHKIKNNNFLDLKKFDGKTVKKQEIIDVQNQFIIEGIEKVNIKILLIENVDKANKYITNSLLKFIEEIPKNTYVIFSTKNKNDVIATITSRCNIINLKQDEELINNTINKLQTYGFSKQETEILLEDLDKINNLLDNDQMAIIKDLKTTIFDFNNNVDYDLLKNYFKDLNNDQVEYLLQILLVNSNDIKTKRDILHLLRFSENQINRNGLLSILINLFI